MIGAGLMGHAIAQIFAAADHPVSIFETNADARAAVTGRIAQVFERRKQDPELIKNISVYEDLSAAVLDTSLVIEAAPEYLDIKQAIFEELGKLTDKSVILATNTSVIPVTDIGKRALVPERVVGTHFWNPPYAVRLVEVVQTELTSADTIKSTMDILAAAGQKPVHVKKDVPGFIGNRLQHALKREAIALVESGICDAETIDFVIKNSFGSRLGVMGTLEQSDLVGLDLTLAIHEVLLPHLDNSPAPQKLLRDLVEAGTTGAKKGKGFRSWTTEQAQELRDRLDKSLLS